MVGYHGKFVYAKVMVEHMSPPFRLFIKYFPEKFEQNTPWNATGRINKKHVW